MLLSLLYLYFFAHTCKSHPHAPLCMYISQALPFVSAPLAFIYIKDQHYQKLSSKLNLVAILYSLHLVN